MTHLLSQIPLPWVRVIITAIFLIIIIWVWLMPKNYIFSSSPDKKIWRDLRIWATAAVITEGLIYLIF